LLAIPQWKQNPRPLGDWFAAFESLNLNPEVQHEDDEGTWIELNSLRTRGYAVIEGGLATAVNFEIHAPDPSEARSVLEQAASSLGWELHEEDDDDDDD
ncbi:MAG TPA: hypothetical protein VFT74_09850, partial [Isosphaeraceae bacterium]|nr:hypothetical protein [Isosphaeraceae bacterium]